MASDPADPVEPVNPVDPADPAGGRGGSVGALERQLASVGPGDHLAQIYTSAAEQAAAMACFVTLGLSRGERCLVVADDSGPQHVATLLLEAGVDVPAEAARGALVVLGNHDTYLRGGVFAPDAMLDFLSTEAHKAAAQGYAALRFVGEMSWSLGGQPGCEHLIPYEARLAAPMEAKRSTLLCQYDRRRFDAACLRHVLRTHRLVLLGDLLCRSQFFEPPEIVLGSVADETKLDWMLHQLRTSAERDRTLDQLVSRMEAVGTVAARLAREFDLKLLLKLIVREASRLAGDAAAMLYLLDDSGHTLVRDSMHVPPRYLNGQPEALRQIEVGQGVIGSAAQSARAIMVNDYRSSSMAVPWALERTRIGAVIAAPILRQSGLIGVLSITRSVGEPAFTEADQQLIVLFADAAAIAIENARLYEALKDRERQLHDLVRRLLLLQEEERRRTALDVHDGLAQLAAATHRHLQAFSHFYHPRSAQARQDLDRALALASTMVGEARRLIAGLRPAMLDDLGLAAAVRDEAEQLARDGWDVECDVSLGAERLPQDVETTLFRICQEALTNVRKHTQPTRVRVVLHHHNSSVHLSVRDWGRGFDAAASPPSAGGSDRVGLASMRERVALLGGRWTLHSQPGGGTTIEVEVPVGGQGRRGGQVGGTNGTDTADGIRRPVRRGPRRASGTHGPRGPRRPGRTPADR